MGRLQDITRFVAEIFNSPPQRRQIRSILEPAEEFLATTAPSTEILEAQRGAKFNLMPVVSIIVLSNGIADDMKHTIESVFAQSYMLFEVIALTNAKEPQTEQKLFDDSRAAYIEYSGNEREALSDAATKAHGEFILFMKAGDSLRQDALHEFVCTANTKDSAEAIYCDEAVIDDKAAPELRLKPDYSPDLLISFNYIGNGLLVKKVVYDACRGLKAYTPVELFDYALRAVTHSIGVYHISKVLYNTKQRNEAPISVAEGRAMLNAGLRKRKVKAYAVGGFYENSFRIRYNVSPQVSVGIVVSCDGDLPELRRCLESIEDVSTYDKYTLTIANRGVNDLQLCRYFTSLKNSKSASVMSFSPEIGYGSALNACARSAGTEIVVFLSSRLQVLTPGWLETLLELANRDEIGAAGCKILTPDNRIVSCGTAFGIGGWWNSPYFIEQDGLLSGRMDEMTNTVRNVTALGCDCIMLRNDLFQTMGGFDESFITEACMIELGIRLARAHRKNVFTPFACLRSYRDIVANSCAPEADITRCYDCCRDLLMHGDPNYNKNFDNKSPIPRVAANPYPAIRLNPLYNSSND